jgi:hypothetical protein
MATRCFESKAKGNGARRLRVRHSFLAGVILFALAAVGCNDIPTSSDPLVDAGPLPPLADGGREHDRSAAMGCQGETFDVDNDPATACVPRTTNGSNAPVAVSDLSNVTAIAAGVIHTCAVRADGSVACW